MLPTRTGFTLFELLVTLAIMSLLLAISYPSFSNALQQSRRTQALQGLLSLQLQQQAYRLDHPQYSDNINQFTLSPSEYYEFSIEVADASGYRLKARAQGSQVSDKAQGVSCQILTLDSGDNKTPLPCWQY